MHFIQIFHREISSGQHDFFDILLKLFGALAAILSALYAIWQYVQAQKGPFRAQQMQCYIEACEAASVLSNYSTNSEEWELAEKKFWVLYWGTMAVIEDFAVSEAMIDF